LQIVKAGDNDYGYISPDWSPTGNQITSIINDYHNYSGISTADADDTNFRYLGGCSMGSPVAEDCYKPKWSPDGSKIIFYKFDYNSSDAEIYAQNIDGSGLVKLTNTTGHNFNPSWQPLTVKSRKRIRFL
jgi:Tol biopolymer transport system component